MYQDGSMTFSAGQDEPGGSQYVSDQPVMIGLVPNDKGRISTGPVDYDLIVAKWKGRTGRSG